MDHQHSMARHAGGKKPRRAVRRQTRAQVIVAYMGSETIGFIRDLSTGGAAIDLQGYFHGVIGSTVTVRCDGLCTVEGRIRWFRNCRIGVEFDGCSNTTAKVHAYFKYFHKDPILHPMRTGFRNWISLWWWRLALG